MGNPMKSDSEIREDVIRELRWDPQVPDPEAIGVAVQDGAVTLTGHVSTYAEKLAAARAGHRRWHRADPAGSRSLEVGGRDRRAGGDRLVTARTRLLELSAKTRLPGRG
jgi:BON domain